MDNKKIGKLISELRNKQNLTQQDLGDKIGVGFRAVSKWECGQTLPDIANMKELSKLFGITLDELLAGKLKTHKKKISKRTKIILAISSIIILTLITTLFFLSKEDKDKDKDKVYVYNLASADKQNYTIDGQITFTPENISIAINKLKFHDVEISSTKIINYEYQLISNNQQLFGYGYSPFSMPSEEIATIQKFSENFSINYIGSTDLTIGEIKEKGIYLIINFIDENNKIINQEIEITLSPINEKNNSI